MISVYYTLELVHCCHTIHIRPRTVTRMLESWSTGYLSLCLCCINGFPMPLYSIYCQSVFSYPDQPLVCRSVVPAHATCSEYYIWQSDFHTYLSPALDPRPHTRPSQQAHCRADEDKDNGLILGRVSLEARSQDVLLLLSGAEAIAEAELTVAVVARLP